MAGNPLSTDISSDDFNAFCDFIVQKQKLGVEHITPEQSVEEFRKHQSQKRWQEKNALSQQQALRGEAKPIDEKSLMARVRERLAQESHP